MTISRPSQFEHCIAKRRIALVTQGYQSSGGVQTVSRWLVRNLRALGHDVDIYNVAASFKDERSRQALAPRTWLRKPIIAADTDEAGVFHVGTQLAEFEPARYLPQKKLTSRLDTYDIVQVVCGGPALANLASRTSTPLIIQMATLAQWERASIHAKMNGARRMLSKLATLMVSIQETRALRLAATTLLENSNVYNHLWDSEFKNIEIAPPGVDTETFTPAPEGWAGKGPIVCIGRLGEARKGHERLISAYNDLRTLHRDTPPLILAGRGSLPTEHRTSITKMGLDESVQVIENVPQSGIVPLLQSASVFVQTSYEEGLGLAAIEAMACGLPVVATETAGTVETVVDGITGYLVPQNQTSMEIAAKIKEALHEGATLSRQARNRAEDKFSDQVTLALFIDAYNLALQKD